MKAVIQLIDYKLLNIEFINWEREQTEPGGLSFGHEITVLDSDHLSVEMDCSVGDEDGEDGVYIRVVLKGLFHIEHDLAQGFESETLQEIFERNTLSILFPYLRSAISDITLKANIDPVIIPTVNINALLASKEDDVSI